MELNVVVILLHSIPFKCRNDLTLQNISLISSTGFASLMLTSLHICSIDYCSLIGCSSYSLSFVIELTIIKRRIKNYLLARYCPSKQNTHPCGFQGSMTHHSQSECLPVGVFWGKKHEQGSHQARRREDCLHASTYGSINQTIK